MTPTFPNLASSRPALLLASLAVALACLAPQLRAAPEANRPAFRKARVVVHAPGGDVPLSVEVAETDAQRTHGLMFKEDLGSDEGMVFVFDRTQEHVFWMKNTPLPLDMVFLDDGRTVVGVYENAEPLSTARMSVGKPSRYVLEVRGGWCRAHRVGKGTALRFEGVE